MSQQDWLTCPDCNISWLYAEGKYCAICKERGEHDTEPTYED